MCIDYDNMTKASVHGFEPTHCPDEVPLGILHREARLSAVNLGILEIVIIYHGKGMDRLAVGEQGASGVCGGEGGGGGGEGGGIREGGRGEVGEGSAEGREC